MKPLALLLPLPLLFYLVACNSPATVQVTSASGQNVNITSSTRLGGRGGVAVRSGDVVVAVYDSNEDSFREWNKTIRLGFWLSALNSIAGSVTDAIERTTATQEATQQLQITTDLQKATLNAPAP